MESTIKKAADGTVTITTTFKPQGDLLDQEYGLSNWITGGWSASAGGGDKRSSAASAILAL